MSAWTGFTAAGFAALVSYFACVAACIGVDNDGVGRVWERAAGVALGFSLGMFVAALAVRL